MEPATAASAATTTSKLVGNLVQAIRDPAVDEIGLVYKHVEQAVEQTGPDLSKLALGAQSIPALFAGALSDGDRDAKSLALLVCNPENHTAWAMRKQLLLAQQTSLGFEVRFCALVLSRSPKTGCGFEHLAFLFRRAVHAAQTKPGRDAVLDRFLRICEDAATRHRRLYYAWALRAKVCEWLDAEALYRELDWGHQWLRGHVSDGSCAAHLNFLVGVLFQRDARLALSVTKRSHVLAWELQWVAGLAGEFPDHEALWWYRRAVFVRWADVAQDLMYGLSAESWRASLRCLDVDSPRFPASSVWWVGSNVGLDHANVHLVLQLLLDEMSSPDAPGGGLWAQRYQAFAARHLLHSVFNVERERPVTPGSAEAAFVAMNAFVTDVRSYVTAMQAAM
jgi:hypothetical protein